MQHVTITSACAVAHLSKTVVALKDAQPWKLPLITAPVLLYHRDVNQCYTGQDRTRKLEALVLYDLIMVPLAEGGGGGGEGGKSNTKSIVDKGISYVHVYTVHANNYTTIPHSPYHMCMY